MGQNRFPEERKRDWLGALLKCGFGCCEEHKDIRFNEKNVFCIDCVAGLCRHCKEAHSLHRRFQIYKYSYQDVVRHYDLQKYFDCSNIQTYVSNNEKIVHLRPRTSTKEFKLTRKSKFDNLCSESNAKEVKVATPPKWGGTCEECGKHLQDERNRFCSITCKISVLPHHAQRIPEEGVDQHDNQNSETESSISVAEPYECFEVVTLRKRPRKANPQKTCYFVFPC
ncbi:hypothetical protein AAZX31_07G160300 [Glycine max]|nr:protein RGF1 INDUCIBLE TRANSCRIPTION FACTOR 1 isoform X1 [Glycine max]KHN10503.1 hypothetical protein glysoja_046909 [Glycine soja]RZC03346.1 hypothetical protein D0Y65_018141 [Glycine soja]|eukprot:XP_025985076.1 uncharacterized protein LOC100820425 isoform X2 [Glycine max]